MPSEERERVKKSYPNNAHVKRKYDMPVIVIGYETKSRKLNKAVLDQRKEAQSYWKTNSSSFRETQHELGISGFIQMSVPPKITGEEYINNLKLLLGLTANF